MSASKPRYYQQRKLLPVPPSSGAFRYYPMSLVARIRFSKRAQELGFSLDAIGELLALEEGVDRASIRRIATDRLLQIEPKLTVPGECERCSSAWSPNAGEPMPTCRARSSQP